MKYLHLTPILTLLLLTSCVHISHNTPNKKSPIKEHNKLTSLSNAGTICAYKPNANSVVIKYYPLSTTCASSSAYSWKLNGFDTKIDRDNLVVNSYSLYKKNNSPIATADCGGARVSTKRVAVKSAKTTLYWGKTKLIELAKNRSIVCFKRVGENYKRVKPF